MTLCLGQSKIEAAFLLRTPTPSKKRLKAKPKKAEFFWDGLGADTLVKSGKTHSKKEKKTHNQTLFCSWMKRIGLEVQTGGRLATGKEPAGCLQLYRRFSEIVDYKQELSMSY